jgi:hypothetical protein
MDRKQIEQHVQILGFVHLVSGGFFAAIGLFVLALLLGIGLIVAADDPMAPKVMGIVGFSVAGLLVALGLPGMVAGYGLLKRKSWGRALAMVVGVLDLFNMPIGTLIGVYTLFVLVQEPAGDYFGGGGLKPA